MLHAGKTGELDLKALDLRPKNPLTTFDGLGNGARQRLTKPPALRL
jgi:hypothetical protein